MNKISYKTYYNDRLKEVDFHGRQTHPLYVQLTYERKTIFWKSYYFELFSNPRFFLDVPVAGKKGPEVELAIKKEHEVIDYIIDKHKDDFTLEIFKKDYAYYSKDVCDLAEVGFREYLFRFFWDEGSPYLGDLVKHGCKHVVAYDLMRDFKRNFTKEKYDKLVKNSFYFTPTYLPLYGFMSDIKRWPEKILAMKEFYDEGAMEKFIIYMHTFHPEVNARDLATEIINLPYSYKNYAEPPTPKDFDPWK